MSVPLLNNPVGELLVVIIIGAYQAASEYIRWEYEPVSDFCPDIESYSDFIVGGSSDELIKYQDSLYDQ